MMTLENAPVGTVILIGHPANATTATKCDDGRWYSNLNHRCLRLDPRDVTKVLFAPKN